MATPPQTHVHRTDKEAFYQFFSTAVRWNQSGLGTRLSLYMAGTLLLVKHILHSGWLCTTSTPALSRKMWFTDCPFMPIHALCTGSALSILCLISFPVCSYYYWHCLQRPDFHQECIIEGYVVLIKLDYINRWLIGYHTENTITPASDHSPQRMHEQRRSTLTKLEPLWAWLI